ncbi:hypothetical protein QWT87_16380 [Chryseobacterium sp. APV1]|uniref:Uncharacterized protein n=1 Tax=Chryseobacterium urinae TaxID=3058400 RepID=A0ABT8UAF4_9FLAO|nr:hypothetical protein [Chryseobacterium sp. APV1]MDO3426459.1 hypothetical protein [Chryseobacterium sp. APV1]
MYKQVIFILLNLFSLHTFSQIPVFDGNKAVGFLKEQTNYNCENCYYSDTVYIFNKKIVIKEPVLVESKNVPNMGFKDFFFSQYYKEIKKINKNNYVIKFNNDSDGNSNWLYISLIKNKIYIVKSLSYSNSVKKIELAKGDFNYISSTLVCKNNYNLEINKEFSFFDFFGLPKKEKTCYHCPRDISVEECLKSSNKIFKWK